jgi:hypothetical protein
VKANRRAFSLSKWYGDVVSAEGNVLIAYSAELRWPPLSVSYESTLQRTGAGACKFRSSIRRHDAPILDDSGVARWDSAHLEFSGAWIPRCSAIEARLLADDEGEIVWSCHLPAAIASIRMKNGTELTGTGYLEHLSMSIPPWRLPIRELRWGRFISPDVALVWIDWTGGLVKRIGLRNGQPVALTMVTDHELRSEDGTRLILDRSWILRTGELGSTALRSVPGLGRFAPARVLALDETKWRSWGELSRDGVNVSSGWAIHEVVKWPS